MIYFDPDSNGNPGEGWTHCTYCQAQWWGDCVVEHTASHNDPSSIYYLPPQDDPPPQPWRPSEGTLVGDMAEIRYLQGRIAQVVALLDDGQRVCSACGHDVSAHGPHYCATCFGFCHFRPSPTLTKIRRLLS